MSKLVITRKSGRILTALWEPEENRIVQMNFDPDTDQPHVGDIYLGRVQNLAKNIQAAFVEIAPGQVCYYPLRGDSPRIRSGEELAVQLTREAVKTKAPVVSSELSLAGKFVVRMENGGRIAISSKITDSARREVLRALLAPFAGPEGGFICRTNSEHAEDAEILAEAEALSQELAEIREQAAHRTCFSKLHAGDAVWLTSIRDTLSESLTDILTDQEDLYPLIRDFLGRHQPEDLGKLSLYQDPLLPLGKLYRLDHALERALNRRVWLRSGGYLVIEPTEALTVIDVNTGKYDGHQDKEETFFRTNREAAREIAAQLRLRNLSGIIVIDFIDMEQEEHVQGLLAELASCLRRDPVKAVLVDRTRLNLVEVTRKKVRKPLCEQVQQKGE